mgnify:CR=1 FL=1
MVSDQEVFEYHELPRPGKLQVTPSKPCVTQHDLSLAYTPGVARPCLAIEADPENAYRFTGKGNLVAVVSNGTAVLGLVSGALGAFGCLRGQGLSGDAMWHAALPGVVLAVMLTGIKGPAVLMAGAAAAGIAGVLLVIQPRASGFNGYAWLALLATVRREDFVPPAMRALAFVDTQVPLLPGQPDGPRMLEPVSYTHLTLPTHTPV